MGWGGGGWGELLDGTSYQLLRGRPLVITLLFVVNFSYLIQCGHMQSNFGQTTKLPETVSHLLVTRWVFSIIENLSYHKTPDLPTLMVWTWDSRFGMRAHGLMVLPLNLTVNQQALNCQTIPEGMKEYREFCAHNSRIQFIKANLWGRQWPC